MKKQNGAGRRKPATGQRRSGTGPKLVLAAVTCVNLILTLVLAVMRRQDTIRALRGDGKLKLLLEQSEDGQK